MSIQGFQAKSSGDTRGEFSDQVLSEGSYQCVIDKIELREGTRYMSTDLEMQLLFYIKPLGVGPEFKDKLLFYQTTTSFFNGKTTHAKSNLKVSKLFTFIEAVYRFYHPKVKVDEMEPKDITDDVINGLEGKQIMAIVKINNNGKNKITDVMSIKEEIKEDVKDPDKELDELLK